MLSEGQAKVIKALVDYVNQHYRFEGKYKLAFDELSTSRDSICITTTGDSVPYEKPDVTGTYMHGTVDLAIVLRRMKTNSSDSDLECISEVDNLYKYIKSIYKEIDSNTFFIDWVALISGAKLDVAYAGGIKDYRGIFTLTYERKVI